MRFWLLVALAGCGKAAPRDPSVFDDLGAALRATIPDGARVIGFGELHARTDRANVKSSLAHFTSEGLPAIADKLSDLAVETWLVDPSCGAPAQEATERLTTAMRRPAATKNEIAQLAEAARGAGIQPHAMHLGCDDYSRIAPAGGEVQPEAMLTLTTRELGRIADEAVAHRDAEAGKRPWIAVYGGALHNDLFPDPSVAEWSYAAEVDRTTKQHFVEIDLIVPEFADGDPVSEKQAWYALTRAGDGKVHVWKRGERSFVIVLPRTKA